MCNSFVDVYAQKHNFSFHQIEKVQEHIVNQFAEAGLRKGFPFGFQNFEERQRNATQHLDPARIKWVEEHAA
ncbi:hypothetical protein [Rhizobium phage RHEph24]|nr:hypothetical protein [Rhizobium phage RHEph24]